MSSEDGPIYTLSVDSGLASLSSSWEDLVPLFEELQLSSVDIANPTLDFLTFAHSAHWFGVLNLVRDFEAEALRDEQKKKKGGKKGESGQKEGEKDTCADAGRAPITPQTKEVKREGKANVTGRDRLQQPVRLARSRLVVRIPGAYI